MSGPTAIFRLSSGQDLLLTVSLRQGAQATLDADIAFRFLQKLSMATAERLERILTLEPADAGERGTRDSLSNDAMASREPETGSGREKDNELVSSPKAMISPVLALQTATPLEHIASWIREALRRPRETDSRHLP